MTRVSLGAKVKRRPALRAGLLSLCALLTVWLAVAMPGASLSAEGQQLLSVSPSDAKLRTLDPTNGKTLDSVGISLGGNVVTAAQALAADPVGGGLYAILALGAAPFNQSSQRALVSLDPDNGKATVIGNVQSNSSALRSIGAMAFDDKGALYGVSATLPSGSNANKLFKIDIGNGSVTAFCSLRNASAGIAMAFNPEDGAFYRVSGNNLFDKIMPAGCQESIGALSGQNVSLSRALAFDLAGGFLYAASPDGQGDITPDPLFPVTAAGSIGGSLGTLDHISKGLAYFPAVAPVKGVAGDFDGDEASDIFWRHAGDGRNKLWFMEGRSRTAAAKVAKLGNLDWAVAGLFDMTGDGLADVVWRNGASGANRLWEMQQATVLAQSSIPSLKNTAWQLTSVADFDGDGDGDFFWHNPSTGANQMWLMNGASRTAKSALPKFAGSKWRPQGATDVDGDGAADILWRHTGTGANRVWLMKGTTRSANSAIPALKNLAWEVQALGDFDGDGKGDIFWRNTANGANQIWLLDGAARKAKSAIAALRNLDWDTVGSGDYDGSGSADLLWRHRTTGANQIWLLDGFNVLERGKIPKFADTQWQVQK